MEKFIFAVLFLIVSQSCYPDTVFSQCGSVKFAVNGEFVQSGNILLTIDGKTTTINRTIAEDIVSASGMIFGYPNTSEVKLMITIEN